MDNFLSSEFIGLWRRGDYGIYAKSPLNRRRGFTMGGAECLGFGWPDKIGSIEKGKLADMIVLDRNIFEEPITELYQTQVELTVLGGDVVYEVE